MMVIVVIHLQNLISAPQTEAFEVTYKVATGKS